MAILEQAVLMRSCCISTLAQPWLNPGSPPPRRGPYEPPAPAQPGAGPAGIRRRAGPAPAAGTPDLAATGRAGSAPAAVLGCFVPDDPQAWGVAVGWQAGVLLCVVPALRGPPHA